MRFALPLFAFILVLSACRHTEQALGWPNDDADIPQLIVGTWTGDAAANCVITFNSDGRFERTSASSPTVRGTWRMFRPHSCYILVSVDGFEPEIYTVRHVITHRLVLLPPFASVAPPQEPLNFTR